MVIMSKHSSEVETVCFRYPSMPGLCFDKKEPDKAHSSNSSCDGSCSVLQLPFFLPLCPPPGYFFRCRMIHHDYYCSTVPYWVLKKRFNWLNVDLVYSVIRSMQSLLRYYANPYLPQSFDTCIIHMQQYFFGWH